MKTKKPKKRIFIDYTDLYNRSIVLPEMRALSVLYDTKTNFHVILHRDGSYELGYGIPYTGGIYSRRIASSTEITESDFLEFQHDPETVIKRYVKPEFWGELNLV